MIAADDYADLGVPRWLVVSAGARIPPGWLVTLATHVSAVVEHRIPASVREGVHLSFEMDEAGLHVNWYCVALDPALIARIEGDAERLRRYLNRRCARCGQWLKGWAIAHSAEYLPSCRRHDALPLAAFQFKAEANAAGGSEGQPTADRSASVWDVGTPPIEAPHALPPRHRLYDVSAVKAVGGNLARQAMDEQRKRIQDDVAKMVSAGGDRPWGVPSEGVDELVTQLRAQFPNFEEVLEDCVRPALTLAELTGKPYLPPMLLVGTPSAGKSFFANVLAGRLGTPCLRIDMSSAQCNSMLAGSATFWGNSRPGLLWSMLVHGPGSGPVGPTANPVVILDEVDKVSARDYDPLAPLYVLLERETACIFEDAAMPGIRLDTSQVIWILTCNDASHLPEPILSRVRSFHIREHTWAERREIAARLVAAAPSERGIASEIACDPEVLDWLAALAPREMRPLIDAALGRSASHGCDRLTLADLPARRAHTAKRGIGFVLPPGG